MKDLDSLLSVEFIVSVINNYQVLIVFTLNEFDLARMHDKDDYPDNSHSSILTYKKKRISQ